MVGAIFEKLVVAGGDDNQVGIVLKHFVQEVSQPVAGVRQATAVNGFVDVLRVAAGQFNLHPLQQRRGILVGSAVDRRAAEAENAERFFRLLAGELLTAEKQKAGLWR